MAADRPYGGDGPDQPPHAQPSTHGLAAALEMARAAKPSWRAGQLALMEACQETWYKEARNELEVVRAERQVELKAMLSTKTAVAHQSAPRPPSFREKRAVRAAHEAEQTRRRAEAERCWKEATAAERVAVRSERQAELRSRGKGPPPPTAAQQREALEAEERATARARAAEAEEKARRKAQKLAARETARREEEAAAQSSAREKAQRKAEEKEQKEAAAAAAAEERRRLAEEAKAVREEERAARDAQARCCLALAPALSHCWCLQEGRGPPTHPAATTVPTANTCLAGSTGPRGVQGHAAGGHVRRGGAPTTTD